jgi:predicted nucleic acid-binding OB-fold protein
MMKHQDDVVMYASNIAQVASTAAVHASARCDGVVTLAKTNRQQFLLWATQAIQNAALVALSSASDAQKALIGLDSCVVAATHRRAEISKCVRTIVSENRRQAYKNSMMQALEEIINAKKQSYVNFLMFSLE